MNMPTVRMKPNSASALKLEVASAAVAEAAVRMQRTMLDASGLKGAQHGRVEAAALRSTPAASD